MNDFDEATQRDFLEGATVPMHSVSAAGIIVWANQAELNLLGYARDEYVGRHIAAFHADAVVIGNILARLSAGEVLHGYPARLRARDGTEKYVSIDSSGRFEDGHFVQTRCITRDVTAEVLAQKRLVQTENRYREMIAALPFAVYTTDAEGYLTHFNQKAEEFAGRPLVIGKDRWIIVDRLYSPEGQAITPEDSPMANSLRTGVSSGEIEVIGERANGTRVHFIPHPTPSKNEAGVVVGGINVLIDITERRKADETRARLAAIVESSGDAVVSKDLSGIIRSWNRGAELVFGYAPDEAIGKPITILIPPGHEDEEPSILDRIRRGERIQHYETVRRRKDATLIHVSLTVSPIVDECGKIIGASKIARDVTQRNRAEAALRVSEERQRRAVEAGKVGLWEWDIPNNRVDWSDYVYELQGIEPGHFEGTVEAFGALVDERDKERVSERLTAALAGTADYDVEFRAVRPDGQTRWLRTSGKVTFGPEGQAVAMHGAVIDVTQQKTATDSVQAIESQLRLLVEASAALLDVPHSLDVSSKLLDLAQRFVIADGYSVWRLGEDDIWRLANATGLSEEYIRTAVIAAAGPTPSGPLLFEDIASEPRLAARNSALIKEGVRSMLVVPLSIHGAFSGTVVFYWRILHKFTDGEVRIGSALGNLAGAALGAAELYDRQQDLRKEAEAAQNRATFSAESGAILSSSLDFDLTLKSVARLAVARFADWAAVDVIDDADVFDGASGLRRVAIHHSDPEKVIFAEEFARKYPPRDNDISSIALRTRKSMLIEEIPEELIVQRARDAEHLRLIKMLGITSVIVVPMVFGNRTFGIITLVTAESGRRFKTSDLQTAEELARRAAAALENARLFKEAKDAQKELARKNEELGRANDSLNQFAYSASHDLQEPLRMVAIFSQLLQRKYADQLNDEARSYIEHSLEGTRRMEALLRDILAYTQAGNTPEGGEPVVSADSALRKALVNLGHSIEEAAAIIEFEPLPEVRIPEVHLLQIFQNLVGNAIKYRATAAPVVRIRASPSPEGILFSVQDNGIGIEPKFAEYVFGLFKRLNTQSEYGGTGVGLAICQKIVERYGGRIWLESKPGAGTTFLFTLPSP